MARKTRTSKLDIAAWQTVAEKKRAIVAVAHLLLVFFYHLLKCKRLKYHELEGDYFDTLDPN